MKPKKPQAIEFTKEGFEKLRADYDRLKSERPDALFHLKTSRELGDLSENGYYKASRFKLSSIDRELRRLSYLLKNGVVKVHSASDIAELGKFVIIENNGEKFRYQLVGREEANPSENKISVISPL